MSTKREVYAAIQKEQNHNNTRGIDVIFTCKKDNEPPWRYHEHHTTHEEAMLRADKLKERYDTVTITFVMQNP